LGQRKYYFWKSRWPLLLMRPCFWILTTWPFHSYTLAYFTPIHLVSIEFQSVDKNPAPYQKKFFPFNCYNLAINEVTLTEIFLQTIGGQKPSWHAQKGCHHYKFSPCTCVKCILLLNEINFDFTKYNFNVLHFSSMKEKKIHNNWRSLRNFNRCFCWKSKLCLHCTKSWKQITWNIK
jgi:hypothetical protein